MRYLRMYVTDKDFVERVLPELREPGAGEDEEGDAGTIVPARRA
jgi:hypothetical protein